MFLSASKVTLSPAFTNWLVASLPNSPASVLADVAVHAALLIAFTTLPTVATLFSSPVFDATVPAVLPSVTLLIVPVLTFTPAASTTNEESAGFTVIWLASFFSNPLPTFTLYLILEVA